MCNKKTLQSLWVISIFVLSHTLAGCRTKPVVTRMPAVNLQETLARGDSEFQKAHLFGWRQAETYYKKAYQTETSDAVKDKLLLTRFLIVTREADEDITDPAMESAFAEVCSGRLSARQELLCDLARRYKAGSGVQPADRKPIPDQTLLDAGNSPLDAYLYALYVQTYGISETNEIAGARAEKFRDSPLFVHLYLGKKTMQRAEELEKSFPDFAELFDFIGGVQFERTQYGRARTYFKKAVELIPDYTRSLNGLGNICLFALEDYEKALEYYQISLKWNPGNAAALYGAGIVYHHLGKYSESNSYLDRMLQTDLSRGGHTSEEAVRYYRGEANYYKAYNYHLLGDSQKAREMVEAAREYLPRSDNVNYLSGLLYYEEKRPRPARDDFMRVVQSGAANCDAHYYLGRIYRETNEDLDEKPPEQTSGVKIPEQLAEYLKQVPIQKEPKDQRSLNYFLGSCSCMEANVRQLEYQIKSVPSMDLDAADKVVLQGRLKNKLFSYRSSSDSLIDGMLRLASSAETEKRDDYINLMKEVQQRIGPAVDQSAAPQNHP